LRGSGRIVIGARVVLDGESAPIELQVEPDAELILGDDVWVEGGTSLEAHQSIRVGDRVRFGAFCKVIDNHYHQVRGDRATRPASQPIVIEDDAEIGRRAILLPGAHIGRGAKIGSGAVITRRVPAGATARGSPARVDLNDRVTGAS
jgi:acetyltransferase-like isoleucine patch superfamily enzyme